MSIETVAATLATEIEAFRAVNVTSHNKATPFARAMLASMVARIDTPATITAAVLHAFKSPKSPKGKPIDKLTTSSADTTTPGFGAMRKTCIAIFTLYDNIDADAPRAATADAEAVAGAAAIRPLIVSFILNDNGAPKSLAALQDAVKGAIAAHVAATAPAPKDVDGDTPPVEGTAPADDGNMTLADRFAALIVAIQADPAAMLVDANDTAYCALLDAVTAAYAVAAPAELEEEQAKAA